MRDVSGDEFQAHGPPAAGDDPLITRLAILRDFAEPRPGNDEFRNRLAHPALERIQRRLRGTVEIAGVDQYGAEPESPEVTVIVPLYGRIDFVEHQLAHFGRDPEFARAELIYVLDSPELAADLAWRAGPLSALHGASFRVVRLARNVGYATANNLGAELAAGRPAAAAELGRDPGRGRVAGPHARVRRGNVPTSARSGPSCCSRTSRSSTPACTSSAGPTPASGSN